MVLRQDYVPERKRREVTDTATQQAPAPQQAVIDLTALQSLAQQIVQVDEKLAAASGNETAMKQSVIDKVVAENRAGIDTVINTLLPQFGGGTAPDGSPIPPLPVGVLVGVFYELPKAMGEEFSGQIDEIVGKKVEELSAGVKQNVDPLKAERKELVDTFKAMEAILNHLKIDTSSVPLPRRSGGRPSGSGGGRSGAGKSGQNKEGMRYYIDGKAQPPSQNSLSSTNWYSSMGCAGTPEAPDRFTTPQFREYLTGNHIVYDGSVDAWEVKLPNGKTVSARKLDKDLDKDIFEVSSDEDSDNDGDEIAVTENTQVETAPVTT